MEVKLKDKDELCNKLENEIDSLKKCSDNDSLLKELTLKDDMIISQKIEIEEYKRIADVVSSDLEIKKIVCLKLEEVVALRKELESFNGQFGKF